MSTEYELKFRATPEILAAIEAAIDGPETRYQMETVYYDTRDRALSARNITLRRRMENTLSVCTLKAPQKIGRQEFEVEKNTIEEALPELCKLSNLPELPQLLQNGVFPLCGAKFTRIAKTVTAKTGVVELALDRGVLTGGGRELPLCEVEVELKEGSVSWANAYAKTLSLVYGLTPEPRSKFARAASLTLEEHDDTE